MKYTFEDWKAGKPFPDHWDCADAIADGWSNDHLVSFMRAMVRPFEPQAKPAEQPAERDQPAPAPVQRPAPSRPVAEARTTQQEQPATVTHLHTRKTVQADDNWQLQLVYNDEGKIKPGVTRNWSLFLEHHPKMVGVFAFDAFKMKIMVMRRPPWSRGSGHWDPRPVQDRDMSEAVMWLEGLSMAPKFSNISPVIQTVAEHAKFDRLTEYLEGLEWDGQRRVSGFANTYLGVTGDAYAPIISHCWLVSSAARGLRPGCKVDTMPILEGPQGAMKSTAIKALYGAEFFTDELSDIGSKDAMMELQGIWGLEVAEMHRFSAAETNAVKKFLSRTTDRFRPPYGRSVIEAPRRVVLNGTINPEGSAYLTDPTGARRFWPLECGKIDIDAINRDRDQLWAEAVALLRDGASWWVQDEARADVEAEQARRTDVDVWVDKIVPLLKTRTSISQWEIFEELGIQKREADRRHSARVARVMKKLGWLSSRDRTGGDDRVVYKSPGASWIDEAW